MSGLDIAKFFHCSIYKTSVKKGLGTIHIGNNFFYFIPCRIHLFKKKMGLESVYYNGIYVDIYLYNIEGPKVEEGGGWNVLQIVY